MYQQLNYDKVVLTEIIEIVISEIIACKCEYILYSSPLEFEGQQELNHFRKWYYCFMREEFANK